MDQNFIDAFNHCMLYEVGGFWNAADPDVIAGSIDTRDQRTKVGYTNTPNDRGGETKYGVAKSANPSVDIASLDLQGAMNIYYNNYWLRGSCDKLPRAIALIHFDACVNNGIGRASKFLQQAVGASVDGQIGPGTLQAVQAADPTQVVNSLSQIRTAFYQAIVSRDSTQGIFLNGWLRRVNEVTAFTLASI